MRFVFIAFYSARSRWQKREIDKMYALEEYLWRCITVCIAARLRRPCTIALDRTSDGPLSEQAETISRGASPSKVGYILIKPQA